MSPRKLPKNVNVDRSRHGQVRLYFRVKGRTRIRLYEQPGTPEFDNELACARLNIPYEKTEKEPASPRRKLGGEGSFDWLVDQYEKRGASLVCIELAERRVRLLRLITDSEKNGKRRGTFPFAEMKRRHVVEIRDEMKETPGARNNIIKNISALFSWGRSVGILEDNPAHGIKMLKGGDGFHTWTKEEIQRFRDKHPRGTMAHRALVVLLFTGLRRSDAVGLSLENLYWRRTADGTPQRWLKITPRKTKKSSGVEVDIPVLPELEKELETLGNESHFITKSAGGPYTNNGFGNKMREWCDEAGLYHCSAHGLRKAGATIAAENGADYELLKAVFGWTNEQQAGHYVRKANKSKIASNAGHFLFLDD